MYLRTVKVPSSRGQLNEYVRIVESYRQGGKVKQRTIADLGRKDRLQKLLPQLERVLKGAAEDPGRDRARGGPPGGDLGTGAGGAGVVRGAGVVGDAR